MIEIVCVFGIAASMYFFSGKHNENKEELKQELVKMKPQEEQVKEEQKVDENFSAQEEIEQIAQGFIANFFDDKPSFLEQSVSNVFLFGRKMDNQLEQLFKVLLLIIK